jgi:hypothetical protein
MADASDILIFAVVVGLRLFVPLLIPRFPLPSILAALVIDAVDQTVFQQFTNLDLDGYQTYDKALDIYYLTIAYVATMRNWGGGFAFKVGRFLWYYRLVGVVIFEQTQYRWLLLVFPNTFEYYFIAIEAIRLRYNPLAFSHKRIIAIAASIWVFIKLPQEWWIHVAKLDFTNAVKEHIFGVEPEAKWGEAFTNRPLVSILLVLAVVGIAIAVRTARKRMPETPWTTSYDSDVHNTRLGWEPPAATARPTASFGVAFIEKAVLIGLVSTIFAMILPGVEAGPLAVIVAVATLIAGNTLVSELFARREIGWASAARQFVAMTTVNLVLFLGWNALWSGDEPPLPFAVTLFSVGLITLLTVLFDRYREIGFTHRLNATTEVG